MKRIDAATAAKLVAEGAVLVDIRERDEYAREHVPGARHHPLAQVDGASPAPDARALIFHCRSGMRTSANVDALRACIGDCDAYLLEGGLDAWKRAGLPIERDVAKPLELNRQVRIAAGSLVLLGALLGIFVAPAWSWLPAAIGAGLVFAGASGFCGLARVLVHMPWNRATRG